MGGELRPRGGLGGLTPGLGHGVQGGSGGLPPGLGHGVHFVTGISQPIYPTQNPLFPNRSR